MKKLIRGIINFRQKRLPGYRETFARLALGHKPDVLFIACSDSRVVPNLFASTEPGDLFVLRNVGNLIPPCGSNGVSESDESEAAAIEFAVLTLNVADIIVCGHSECGAMGAIFQGREKLTAPHLKSWLRHGLPALDKLPGGEGPGHNLAGHNRLSQLNVLQQTKHLQTYPVVRQRVEEGKLRIHAWWFDIAKADVFVYDTQQGEFILIDENEEERLLTAPFTPN